MDALDSVFNPLIDFSKDNYRLVKRCHKPDCKEFTKVAFRTAIGFIVIGLVGFFVKLIFIPINNIIVSLGTGKETEESNLMQQLSNACLVVDALEPLVREELVKNFCNRELTSYRQIFEGAGHNLWKPSII